MSAATAQSDSNRSAWTVILAGAALIATLAMGTWGWQKYAHPPEELVRPAPIYLSIDKIESKMSDGSVSHGSAQRNVRERQEKRTTHLNGPVGLRQGHFLW